MRVRPVGRLVASVLCVGLLAACDPSKATPDVAGSAPAPGVASPSAASSAPATPGTPETYAGTVEVIPPGMARGMTGVSWRPGCPVPLADLRLVRLTFVGFDGATQPGELIAHKDVADAIVRIFAKLYAARFPIRKMVRIDAYGGSDDASMADDNTSMFNCRKAWGSSSWSNHAYGRAIDVNTVENPYLPGKEVLPSAGAPYVDRRVVRPGMIIAGGPVVRAFRAEGFRWGGDWRSEPDYQHFEKPG